MITDRTRITRELDELMHEQIRTFKQDAKISESDLDEFRQRSQRIRILCQTLNRAGPQTWAANQSA